MTRRRRAASLALSLPVLVLLVSHCSVVLGIHDVPQPSDGGRADTAAATPFLGTWKAATVVSDVDCDGTHNQTQLYDTLTIEVGTTSTLSVSNGDCTVLANVSQQTAFILPGQSCTLASGDSFTFDGVTPSDNSYALDPQGGGRVLNVKYLGYAHLASQPDTSCIWAVSGDYAKQP